MNLTSHIQFLRSTTPTGYMNEHTFETYRTVPSGSNVKPQVARLRCIRSSLYCTWYKHFRTLDTLPVVVFALDTKSQGTGVLKSHDWCTNRSDVYFSSPWWHHRSLAHKKICFSSFIKPEWILSWVRVIRTPGQASGQILLWLIGWPLQGGPAKSGFFS